MRILKSEYSANRELSDALAGAARRADTCPDYFTHAERRAERRFKRMVRERGVNPYADVRGLVRS